jgi:hypothetical protein
MNNQLTFTRVCSFGYEGVGKGIAMQWFEQNQACLMLQKEVCV